MRANRDIPRKTERFPVRSQQDSDRLPTCAQNDFTSWTARAPASVPPPPSFLAVDTGSTASQKAKRSFYLLVNLRELLLTPYEVAKG